MNPSKDIAASISHILVRPQVGSTLNLHDRHPYRLVRDLIKHYDTIFSEQSVQSHENHIHRRAIVATSPTSQHKDNSLDGDDDDNNKDFAGSSAASSSGSSVLLSTPTTITNFGHDMDEPIKSPISPRSSGSKRNLLSFMRRSSSTATSSSSPERTPTSSSIPTSSSTPRRPIPMPSKSTLFEDPDDDDDEEESTARLSSNEDHIRLSREDQPMKNMTSDKELPPVPSSDTLSTKEEQGDNITTTTALPDTNKESISIEEEEDKPHQKHHSRMSSVGTFQGSLDSFFKDDDT
ncbi:hypothetical protein K492DRAFT_21278 [Lichtheimia hyalospora FSU 10163]|nr:hypothetical protein K492DRAFT_21278 [Lichtheimia hyalospora FSU 10163]